jgi:hypothetical protein
MGYEGKVYQSWVWVYGVGYPKGKKTATGCPPCGWATPETAVKSLRPFCVSVKK